MAKRIYKHAVFRVDASGQIGAGHVMRCLTLADALADLGFLNKFVCRKHEGHMIELIEQRGYRAIGLDQDRNFSMPTNDLAHAGWLGSDWISDSEETKEAMGSERVDWLVVDHYAIDRRWHQAMRPFVKRLLVLDDIADRSLDCDLLLNQNYGSSSARYEQLVPKHCMQLHGPGYALLKPLYSRLRDSASNRSGEIFSVLIYFGGGSDNLNLTSSAVEAFNTKDLKHIHLDVVVSVSYAHLHSLQVLASERGHTEIHSQLPDLANLMAQADLAIGAGGATTWERCCLGLPSIVVSIADNQNPACVALADSNIIQYPGEAKNISASHIREVVRLLLQNSKQMLSMSQKSMNLVDGLGVLKVVDIMKHKDND